MHQQCFLPKSGQRHRARLAVMYGHLLLCPPAASRAAEGAGGTTRAQHQVRTAKLQHTNKNMTWEHSWVSDYDWVTKWWAWSTRCMSAHTSQASPGNSCARPGNNNTPDPLPGSSARCHTPLGPNQCNCVGTGPSVPAGLSTWASCWAHFTHQQRCHCRDRDS